jgi:hypothetical protein
VPSFPVVKVDTEGLGKGLEKLADLAESFGVLAFGPRHTVRMATADAEALVIRAEAEVEVANIKQRALYRLSQEALRNQENIEAVYNEAAGYLPKEVSDEPVSGDWAAKFNDRARFASDHDVRTIWAKVLASEVAKPKSVSARTIALIDAMSRDEAKALEAILARAAFVNQTDLVLLRVKRGTPEEDNKSQYGVTYQTFENLRAAGLIAATDITSLHGGKGETIELRFGKAVLHITQPAGGEPILPVFFLTRPCWEIATALCVPVDELFLDDLCEWAAVIGLSVSCPLA